MRGLLPAYIICQNRRARTGAGPKKKIQDQSGPVLDPLDQKRELDICYIHTLLTFQSPTAQVFATVHTHVGSTPIVPDEPGLDSRSLHIPPCLSEMAVKEEEWRESTLHEWLIGGVSDALPITNQC